MDLALVWAGLIAFAVLAYVWIDGFDLGVGVLFGFFKDESDRDLLINTIAPVWDGNETWLVLGGGGLLAVFPLAYAIIFPAIYIPVILMLLGLIFRGVAFEFRWRGTGAKALWDIGFAAGSILAAFAQGVALGTLVQGIEVSDRQYAGGWWDWLTPFSVLTGIALVVGYALLGATWLFMKTNGQVQARAGQWAQRTMWATLALVGLVSIATPWLQPAYLDRWFSGSTMLFSFMAPALLAFCGYQIHHGLNAGKDIRPFFAALGIFGLCYAGIIISFYPYMVPTSVTLWQAAAPENSLSFLLTGALVLLPLILAYTGYAYWIFRGKTDPDAAH